MYSSWSKFGGISLLENKDFARKCSQVVTEIKYCKPKGKSVQFWIEALKIL